MTPNLTQDCFGYVLTLLSGLKIRGCTLMASVTPEAAEMMAYATPGLPAETPGTAGGVDELCPCPLDSLLCRKVLLAVGRDAPWLFGLITAMPCDTASVWPDCCSRHGLWGRLSGIRVFGLTYKHNVDRC